MCRFPSLLQALISFCKMFNMSISIALSVYWRTLCRVLITSESSMLSFLHIYRFSVFSASVGQKLQKLFCMGQHLQKLLHRFCVGIEVIIILCPLTAYFYQSGILQYLQMMRYCGAGKMRLGSDSAHANPAALAHLHHFQNEMLTVFIAECRQRSSTRCEFLCQGLNIFQGIPPWFICLNHYTIVFAEVCIGKENRDD